MTLAVPIAWVFARYAWLRQVSFLDLPYKWATHYGALRVEKASLLKVISSRVSTTKPQVETVGMYWVQSGIPLLSWS